MQAKVVMLGDMSVGKSALIMRYVQEEFLDTMVATVGASYQQKQEKVNGTTITLQIWDTAGQERYSNLASLYYRACQAVILCWDVSKPETLKRAGSWIQTMSNELDITKIIIVLVANKIDLEVSKQAVDAKMEEFKRDFPMIKQSFKVSAKNGDGVSDIFNFVAREIASRQVETAVNPKAVTVTQQKDKKGGCC